MQARDDVKSYIDWTTEAGFEVFWKFLVHRTKKDFSTNPALKEALKNIILKFNETTFIKLDSFLGGGHWSFAFKALEYDIVNQKIGEGKFVLKMTKPDSTNFFLRKFHSLERRIVPLEKDFVKEAELYKKRHGLGEHSSIRVKGKKVDSILIPFLGDMPLSSLLREPYLLARIPMKEWLDFFHKIIVSLNKFHQSTGYIHNDIKPSNITFFIKALPNNLFGFREVNPIDFGNAQLPKHTGRFGDLNYGSPIKGIAGLAIPFKDREIDIYALGTSFLKVLKTLKDIHRTELDDLVLQQCKALAEAMCAFTGWISLDKAAEQIRLFQTSYEVVEEREKVNELEQDLRGYINRVDLQLKEAAATKWNTKPRMDSCLFPPLKEPNLSDSVEAAKNLLRLMDDPAFKLPDGTNYNTGELGKIMSRYRLRGRLPEKILEVESNAIPENTRLSISAMV